MLLNFRKFKSCTEIINFFPAFTFHFPFILLNVPRSRTERPKPCNFLGKGRKYCRSHLLKSLQDFYTSMQKSGSMFHNPPYHTCCYFSFYLLNSLLDLVIYITSSSMAEQYFKKLTGSSFTISFS